MKLSIEKLIIFYKLLIAEKKIHSEVCSKLGYTLQTKSLVDEISIYKEFKDNLENILNSNKE
jgi:hypothetical protein